MGTSRLDNKLARNQKGETIVEQSVSVDNNPLPAAVELEKLKEIDPAIIPWLMARAEQEQNARHSWNKTQEFILTHDVKNTHRFNLTVIILAFLLFVVVMGASVFCIANGLSVEGTAIGGTAIITGIIFFLRVSIRSKGKAK